MKIYIISGTTGDYNDILEWDVCAYMDRNLAETRVYKLLDTLKKYNLKTTVKSYGNVDYDKLNLNVTKFKQDEHGDSNMFYDYTTGTQYNIRELELVDIQG